MKRVRVGIVGLGVGLQHIHGYRAHPDAEVVALCDIDPNARARALQTVPTARAFHDANAMIREVDVVSIATYDDSHYDQVSRALDEGKHVFVEKPLCLRVAEFHSIRQRLAEHPDLQLSSNLVLRQSPRFNELRTLINAGALGRLFNIEGDYLYGRLEKLTQGWRGRIPNYSVTLGGAIHLIDLLLWLTGDTVQSVVAVGNSIASEGSAFSGRDFAAALLTFRSGLVGRVSANFGAVCPHFHRLAVFGTQGTFENGRDAAQLWRSRDPHTKPELLTSAYPGVSKGDLIPSFIDAVLGRGAPRVTRQEVLDSMAVGLSIDRSLEEGRVVSVAEIKES